MERRQQVREALAANVHNAWTRWMAHVFSNTETLEDGSVRLPADSVSRWRRQMETDYALLSPSEQDSDRREADLILQVIEDCVGGDRDGV